MSGYDNWTDFAINAAVFEELNGGSPDYEDGVDGAMVLISFEGDLIDGNPVEVRVPRGRFNPCNNPSDAWPIIVDNAITIEPDTDMCCTECYEFYHNGSWEASYFGSTSSHTCENPLRAAMIVFLMMRA